jgi:hypothetical protein
LLELQASHSTDRVCATAAAAASPRARAAQQLDPRVQQRTYHFGDTNEGLSYAVFVSTTVKDGKSPLIIALHGLGGNPNTLIRGSARSCGSGGYIVFAPAGYNPRGWYGIPWTIAPPPGVAPRVDPAAAHDPPNLSELAEKDVMNLLAMARKESRMPASRNTPGSTGRLPHGYSPKLGKSAHHKEMP